MCLKIYVFCYSCSISELDLEEMCDRWIDDMIGECKRMTEDDPVNYPLDSIPSMESYSYKERESIKYLAVASYIAEQLGCDIQTVLKIDPSGQELVFLLTTGLGQTPPRKGTNFVVFHPYENLLVEQFQDPQVFEYLHSLYSDTGVFPLQGLANQKIVSQYSLHVEPNDLEG